LDLLRKLLIGKQFSSISIIHYESGINEIINIDQRFNRYKVDYVQDLDSEINMKIVVFGCSKSGKTSLVNRYTNTTGMDSPVSIRKDDHNCLQAF